MTLQNTQKRLIVTDLLWWPLAQPEHNDSSAFVVAHLRTKDQVPAPDVLQSGRRASTHVRIVVLDHSMRAGYQAGSDVHIPIAPTQKSEIQVIMDW